MNRKWSLIGNINEDNIGSFLEAFEEIAKRFNENKQNAFKSLENESSNTRLVDERYLNLTIGSSGSDEARELSVEERESIYCEVIYTIKHKIGRTIDGHNDYILDLYKYAQDAFKMSQQDHDRLFAHTCEEKAPIIILNVEVIEARGLEAKDANGFSDPYCMLGIIPGNRAHTLLDTLNNLNLNSNSSNNANNNNNNQSSQNALNEIGGGSSTAVWYDNESASSGSNTTSTTSAGAPPASPTPQSGGIGNFNRTQTVSYLNPGRHSTKASESSSSSKSTSLIKRFSSFRKSADKYGQQQQQVQLNQQQQQLNQSGQSLLVQQQHGGSSHLTGEKDNTSRSNRLFASHKIVKALKDGKLPAKYIKTTDVKKATLSPIWNERFRLQVDDIKHDTLHLDIWDHDDETSVFDAAKKLNEVKSLKGLDRYFKQIAQSARASASNSAGCVGGGGGNSGNGESSMNVDDFLGSVNVPLDELASSGVDRWFELDGRSEHKKAEGRLHLRLKLATREDRGGLASSSSASSGEENNFNDFKQHEHILETFVQYELERRQYTVGGAKNSEWSGELGREAETILHQHAIQGDLTDFQIVLCRWIAYSRIHLEKELSYKVLYQKLELLEKIWNSSSPTRDEAEELRESFNLFIRHCFKLIANLRDAFPVTLDRKGLEKLEYVLKLLNKIFNMDAFKYAFPFQNSLIHELVTILKNATSDWFEKMCEFHLRKSDDDAIKKLIEFTQAVYIDVLIAFKHYKTIFEVGLNINYFAIMYKKIDTKLMDLIKKILTEEFGEDIKRYSADIISAYSQASGSHFNNSPPNVLTPSPLSTGNGSSTDLAKLKKDTSGSPSLSNQNLIFKYNTITEKISITLFELYTIVYSIYKFRTFLNESERSSLKIHVFYEIFYMPYKRWVDLLRRKVESKVEKCFESEKTDVLTELTKYGSSSVEMCNCFTQVSAIWRLIDWPDFIGVQMFLVETIDCLTKAAHRYASQIKDNCQNFIVALSSSMSSSSSQMLSANQQQQQQQTSAGTPTGTTNPMSSNTCLLNAAQTGSSSNRSLNNNGGGGVNTGGSRQTLSGAPTSSLDACQKLMIATNNLERVRESLRAYLTELDLDRYVSLAERVEKTKLLEANRANFEAQVNQASEYLSVIIEYILEGIITNKIIPELDPHMFYLLESPESAKAQESTSRIIEYMDNNLGLYKDFAFKPNYSRLLKLLWEKLLVEIENNVKKDDQRSNVFFAKISDSLDILLAFFSADNQGLAKDFLQSSERYKQLKKYLKLQTNETSKLISLYYQEMIAIQNSLKSSEYGSILCRAFFHSKDDTLVVEVVKCKNLIPMDQNGLSDPYVEIELKPRYAFQSCEKQYTSVIKKCLNPIFNEVFEFKIPQKSCYQPGNVIHFTVMDHDLVWSNDFEGEAFLELQSLPGVRNDLGEGGYKDLKYTELFLIRPKDYPSKIMEVLEYRTHDKIATDFLKMRKEKLKI